ncbi:MAG: 3-phosphoglycerate dehydrogenase family protein [Oscillospiraceae bacterium]|nr:3-phosphoglycerate dehydrogenase family protein [Oscillospiraceae bacterium]MCL2279943.1 3-phosphoglycerate dehydrogenase family protein [Oscillospiraceae bacterium]
MYKIKLMNSINSPKLEMFDESKYEVSPEVENPDALMVRSVKLHDTVFNKELLCIARAGAGINNIPVERCAKEGIAVFNTPGANAEAVKELILCSLFLSSRDVVSGIEWVKKIADKGDEIPALVEKKKAQYAGPEIFGKTLGVIGLGAVGKKIAEAALALGMNVLGYDPYLSVKEVWLSESKVERVYDLDGMYKKSDYITINAPYTEQTKHLINKEALAKMKHGVKIINAARAELVNDDDMIEALETGQVVMYVTDFPNAKTAGVSGIIAIPHLGASTPESGDNCVSMAAQEIIEYLENGNILNSVNLPTAVIPRIAGDPRVCVIHENIPDMIAKITSTVSSFGANIENMLNAGSKGNIVAYTILDVLGIPDGLVDALEKIEGVIRVRTIK